MKAAVLAAASLGLAACAAASGHGAEPLAAPTACNRPYSASSPWNTPVGRFAVYHERSDFHVASLQGSLTSDPKQYTYPVYQVDSTTPLVSVSLRGWYSNVVDGGRTLRNQRGGEARLPVPVGALPAAGTDAQMIMINPATGDEWGASNLQKTSTGWRAWNAYHYNTRWNGVPPKDRSGRPFFLRGAGVPYLAGLVRPCEIARGRIDHALAFANDFPTPRHVYPATKSDGKSTNEAAMPEGSRLQLDPSLDESTIRGWGCVDACLTVARALQRYGMILIDASGREKVMFEYDGTARWGGLISSKTVSPIPLAAFKLLEPCSVVGTQGNDVLHGTAGRDVVCGVEGNDVLRGHGGDDRLIGGDGRDVLHGNAGDDRLIGDADRDTLRGGDGSDLLLSRDNRRDDVFGGAGRDTAWADARFDRLADVEARTEP